MIVANLPYIRTKDIKGLQPELHWEPLQALDGGESGLELIERLITQAETKTPVGAVLWLEIGNDQSPAVEERLKRTRAWRDIGIHTDFAGWPRFMRTVRKESPWTL